MNSLHQAPTAGFFFVKRFKTVESRSWNFRTVISHPNSLFSCKRCKKKRRFVLTFKLRALSMSRRIVAQWVRILSPRVCRHLPSDTGTDSILNWVLLKFHILVHSALDLVTAPGYFWECPENVCTASHRFEVLSSRYLLDTTFTLILPRSMIPKCWLFVGGSKIPMGYLTASNIVSI